jgi:polyisoprenoid-binding protein YceI
MMQLAELLAVTCAAFALSGPPDAPKAQAPAAAAQVKEPAPTAPLPEGSVLYHTLTGREAQVIFTSDAPLEQIVGKSNAVVGFAASGPKDSPAKLAAATWILPVTSIATGIPLRDEHLAGKDWLDAAKFPEIKFVLTRVEDIRELKGGEGYTTSSATLVGNMTIHGVTREVHVPDARFSFLKESAKTKGIAAGDLLFLKCEYAVKLSDYGIVNGDVPKKVADEVKLTQTLRLSTVVPAAK